MILELPASIERDLERYAEAEQISATEAAAKLLKGALKAEKRKASKGELTAEEWRQLRAIPTFAFFENLPESVINSMEAASKQTRAERFTPRG